MHIKITKELLTTYGKRGKIGNCVRLQANAVISWIKESNAKNILEVGCGSGFYTFMVSKYVKNVKRVTGVDTSDGFIKPPTCQNIFFLQANGLALPFPDETFDCVYSMDVIEHISN